MTFPSRTPSFPFRPGLMLLVAGAFLSLSALVMFFAGNWHTLPAPAKFSLAAGGTALMLALALASERKGLHHPATLALFSSAMFTGLFWVVFGQTFQSGATFRELCLAWAVSVVPIFLLRRTASLWNQLVVLLSVAACSQPVLEDWQGTYVSHLLAPLLTAAAFLTAALLPPSWLRRPRGLNAWLALPLTLLLAEATVLCTFCILSLPLRYQPSLPELAAGPLVLVAALGAGLITRHALTLCEISLCGVVLMNAALFRLLDDLPVTAEATLFTLANGASALLLASALPRLSSWKHHPRLHRTLARVPAFFGGLLCALSLMTMTAFVFAREHFSATLLAAGLLYMLLGTLLWRIRRQSTFVAVLGSMLVSGGSLSFHIGLLDYGAGIILASVWAAAAMLYALINYTPLRFFTVFWALVSTMVFLPQLAGDHLPLSLPVFVFCALPLATAAWGRFPQGILRPAAFACLASLPFLSPFLPPLSPLRLDFGTPEEKAVVTLAVLNLAVMMMRRLTSPARSARSSPSVIAAAVAVLPVLWFLSTPETLIALNMLAAGTGENCLRPRNTCAPASHGDGALIAFGALALIGSSVLFCVVPEFSFRFKMLHLGIPGLCLFFSGLQMERRTTAFARSLHPDNSKTSLLRQSLPFALCALAIAALFSVAVADRLTMFREGRTVLLRLRPQERQVFMLGDSMHLLYDADRNISSGLSGPGCLPLDVRENGTAEALPEAFIEGADCSTFSGPAITVEKTAFGRMRLRLPRRWYFQEGLGMYYEDAVFAALLFDGKNRILLRGLADKKGRIILPPHTEGFTDEKSAPSSPKEDENAPE